jgi:radical SAM protein with 4Fe4S-binding SPASM domain
MTCDNSFFCPLPWVHLSLEPDGNVYSCCNAIEFPPLGNIQKNTLTEIQKSEAAHDLRQQFERGEVPEQCGICVKQEAQGALSLREASLRQFKNIKKESDTVQEFLGLRFDNYCNYSCRICNPQLSTGWYNDFTAQQRTAPKGPIIAIPKEKSDEFFQQIKYGDLKFIYLAGGEPFLSPDFYRLLDSLEERSKFNFQFKINTNFSFPKKNRNEILSRLNQYQDVFLNLSLDGFRERGDYMRKGQKWSIIERDILYTKQNFPNIKLGLFITVSVFNIIHLEEFIGHMLDKKLIEIRNIRINPLLEPNYISTEMASKAFKDEALKSLTRLKKIILSKGIEAQGFGLVQQINGLVPNLNEPEQPELLTFFLKETMYLDGIRGESFQKLFSKEYNLLKS